MCFLGEFFVYGRGGNLEVIMETKLIEVDCSGAIQNTIIFHSSPFEFNLPQQFDIIKIDGKYLKYSTGNMF